MRSNRLARRGEQGFQYARHFGTSVSWSETTEFDMDADGNDVGGNGEIIAKGVYGWTLPATKAAQVTS